MKPIPLTRRHHLQHFTATLETNGFSSERILGRLNMPMWQYGDPNDLIPLTHVLSVLREASRLTGEERLGQLVGEYNFLRDCTAYGTVVSNSLTVYDAMHTACQLAPMHTSLAKMWLKDAGDTIWYCRAQLKGMDAGLRQHEQYVLMAMISIVRMGAGAKWKPADVWLCTPKEPRLEESEGLSGINFHYNQPHGAIAVPKSVICRPIRPIVTQDRNLSASEVRRFMAIVPDMDFVGSLRQMIDGLLGGTRLSLDTVAEILGLNGRGLQRQLATEARTFKQLVDEARFCRATTLLEDPDFRITDIAYHLGYSDVAHFSRAFHRWAAVSPREYRHLTLAN